MGKKRKTKHRSGKNKYDSLSKPEAEFDFHDKGVLTRSEILRMTDEFVQDCQDRGLTKILFITGKGLHSRKGMPIIKPLVKNYLKAKPYIQRVYEGRFDRGGSGTLEVILD